MKADHRYRLSGKGRTALELAQAYRTLRQSASDQTPVSGLTHRFYSYPARFSPRFARTAISLFSRPGDLVLDPFMGGGTTLVEATTLGRKAVGCDLNDLAVFVSGVKTTSLTECERAAVRLWSARVIPSLSYRESPADDALTKDARTRNLGMARSRPIKKALGLALESLVEVPWPNVRSFIRCGLLGAGQWALNGRLRMPTLSAFRKRLGEILEDMLEGVADYQRSVATLQPAANCILITGSASRLSQQPPFSQGVRADLVVTSPPYPGIHVLYHRWQVNGRRETPAPYWLSNCQDGHGASYYTFVGRDRQEFSGYFAELSETLLGIRSVMKPGARIVQMVAFSDPRTQLRQYLRVMQETGFEEERLRYRTGRPVRRIWRPVPGRKWHAMARGTTPASMEVVLVHRAVPVSV